MVCWYFRSVGFCTIQGTWSVYSITNERHKSHKCTSGIHLCSTGTWFSSKRLVKIKLKNIYILSRVGTMQCPLLYARLCATTSSRRLMGLFGGAGTYRSRGDRTHTTTLCWCLKSTLAVSPVVVVDDTKF